MYNASPKFVARINSATSEMILFGKDIIARPIAQPFFNISLFKIHDGNTVWNVADNGVHTIILDGGLDRFKRLCNAYQPIVERDTASEYLTLLFAQGGLMDGVVIVLNDDDAIFPEYSDEIYPSPIISGQDAEGFLVNASGYHQEALFNLIFHITMKGEVDLIESQELAEISTNASRIY